ncbi:hypothetical protein SK355_01195 [Candidatus Fukatsuia symbiotica]|uniref:Uncharacterized protein n=1 Tax=Candidatus Fukatsuia symbiotica TaxID=1878942 RepID=A0A2U8I7K2_9GAMM|nr:hypothetical protein [Candidatus Fukatsuia symbiotica]AWK15146.1 hypothetical protein CCS41_12790 [Candidatus Fukatsuia symbiotica]MEA9443970.1 hypothetical protein [Candidatus Fukatsuia symbiotica]
MKKFLQFIVAGFFLCLSVSIQAITPANSEIANNLAASFSMENCPECKPGGADRDLCEKCSKVTRDKNVFPLCCNNTAEAKNWCSKFLNYTPPIL